MIEFLTTVIVGGFLLAMFMLGLAAMGMVLFILSLPVIWLIEASRQLPRD